MKPITNKKEFERNLIDLINVVTKTPYARVERRGSRLASWKEEGKPIEKIKAVVESDVEIEIPERVTGTVDTTYEIVLRERIEVPADETIKAGNSIFLAPGIIEKWMLEHPKLPTIREGDIVEVMVRIGRNRE